MKVLHHTDDKIVLEYRPILFMGAFALVSFLTFGWGLSDLFAGRPDGNIKMLVASLFVAFTLFMVERSRLTMDASTGTVDFRTTTVFGRSHHIYSIKEISRFEVETTSGNDGSAHRIIMIIDQGEAKGRYPLTRGFYTWLDQSIPYTANRWLLRSGDFTTH